jgi:hypothetical protein
VFGTDENPSIDLELHNIGLVLKNQGKYEEELIYFKK